MSGIILTQSNVAVEVDLGTATFVPFDCVTSIDPGTGTVSFVDVSCFSTPTAEPEYASGRLTRSTGSVAYRVASSSAVHQHMIDNPGGTVKIRTTVNFPDGAGDYVRTQDYLIGGTSEPIEFDGEYVWTTELQPTGPITRAYA